jgi:hypothetical protein
MQYLLLSTAIIIRERSSILHYTYIACFVEFLSISVTRSSLGTTKLLRGEFRGIFTGGKVVEVLG